MSDSRCDLLDTDDALMICWRCALMMRCWFTNDALMMHWWATDDALMMRQWRMSVVFDPLQLFFKKNIALVGFSALLSFSLSLSFSFSLSNIPNCHIDVILHRASKHLYLKTFYLEVFFCSCFCMCVSLSLYLSIISLTRCQDHILKKIMVCMV